MRGMWERWVMALGVVVLTASVSMAQPAGARKDIAESSAWWSDLFSFGSSKTPPKPIPEPLKTDKDKGKTLAAPAPEPTVANKADQYQRLRNALQRRQAVIDRLREIANETDDTALIDEADRLDEMAMRIYQQESNKVLGVATIVTQPDALDKGNAAGNSSRAIRAASPGGLPPADRGTTANSLERSAGLRGNDR